ncbi:MAG: helix-turn-helix transcriptional regulator [Deltaproteobacteria bacterium]|nr:helix-turn-helix transcriptional regulator [Deltaproteobacteria bacterium]MCW8891989.1 helix-turn-helix transcriptional regulator [Deltaproteobacteria bacterium]MCW9050249.1 helix-turn-helix transcriptional regulator [Deltaproteobacteria bacterium]
MQQNHVKEIRESLLISKAELARLANISPLTVSRIENGYPCRMETMRKIIFALGFKKEDKTKFFPE